ncbi:MAG: hypothetical protein A3F33_00405 [Candidatus Woykebacteria bacterium RIFCSPHIGHO2_12_FULL_43_10]|uniref:Uncharacterized protein n=1 Tax=Candidatus Woykebacteria bacterium RIFCSPLOWO2_01_FULL_43_14 TaxID=1802605 RepID=A0A1G1WXZ9_9BACT|nr:MAG: hypothetical protein A3F33_00405 [Candidatus Woykebacteria bacterium RIFCSPHIGHO2_12_FULL_43_10]OGY32595.1 MAG: hypothetical protein A3A61_03725 [Candidatus Woykebacteria bacterium RIFCSPLOWO2_01_FULL_43_14]
MSTSTGGLIDLWEQTHRGRNAVCRETQMVEDRLGQIQRDMSPLFQDLIQFPGPHSRGSGLELGLLLAEEASLVSCHNLLVATRVALEVLGEELRLCLMAVFLPS